MLRRFIIGIVMIVTTIILAFAIIGCSENDTNNENVNTPPANERLDAAELELAVPTNIIVEDFGWITTQDGYVDFALQMRNENSLIEARDVFITISLVDEDGNVIKDETTQVSSIAPSANYLMSYVANADRSIDATSISGATASVDVQEWVMPEQDDPDSTTAITYAIADESTTIDEDNGTTLFTGKIAVRTDGNETAAIDLDERLGKGINEIPTYVNIILRDENEKIIAGYYDAVEVPLNGNVIDFTVHGFEVPQYTTIDIVAHPFDYVE